MKNLYLSGIQLEKRKEFNAILEDLKKRDDVFIVSLPIEQFNIVEMRYKNGYNDEREATGETFIGYDYCYVSFLYRGKLIYIQASAYYPFTDENYPEPWNYTVYEVTGLNKKKQRSYFIGYNGVDNIKTDLNMIRNTNEQSVDVLHNNFARDVAAIVSRDGGYREKEIVKKAIIQKGETWNDDHKVVNVLSVDMEEDGYMKGFQVDLVTRSICG